MIAEKKKQMVPQLRFSEFDGEWDAKKLGEITSYTKGYAFKSDDYKTNGIRIVRVSDLTASSIKSENDKVFIDEGERGKYEKYLLKKDNIIITTVGSKPEMLDSAVGRGIFIENENEGLLNQNMLKFENSKLVSNKFLIGFINSTRYQYFIKGIARGNANQSNITVKDLLSYKINLPSLPEQQKIASFLTAVDKKLQQLTTKKEQLEDYKKGVMQQLFSQQLRFKDEDGNDFPDWEEKKLGEVLTIGSGKDYKHLNDGEFPVYGTGGYMTSVNDYLYDGESVGIGRKGTIDKPVFLTGKFWTVDTLFYTHSFKKVLPFYVYLVFQTINWKLYNEASGVPSLSKATLDKIKMKIPSLKEQQKIAVFLSALDAKIESVAGQIEKTKEFKKGLLQQLFV